MQTPTSPQNQRIEGPVRLDGHVACPRCQHRLFFDGDEFVCVTCGYEHDPMAARTAQSQSVDTAA